MYDDYMYLALEAKSNVFFVGGGTSFRFDTRVRARVYSAGRTAKSFFVWNFNLAGKRSGAKAKCLP